MTKIMKKIALLLAVAIFVLGIPAASAEKTATVGESELALLKALGIVCFDTSDLKLNEGIAKADYITMLVNVFFDKQYKKLNSEALRIAVDLDLIDSVTEKTNSFIEYDDAVEMTFKLLGYFPIENYSSHEYDIAKANLLKGIKPFGKFIKASDAMKLMKNFIETDILQVVSVSVRGAELKVYEGETPLAVYRGIYKRQGTIDGTYETSLYGPSNLKADEVSIDAVTYKTKVAAEKYIGQNVYMYVADDREGKGTILYMEPYDNEILSVASRDISNLSDDLRKVYYWNEKGKEKRIDLSPSYKLICNGVVLGDYTEEDILSADGTVIFVDNGIDGEYDLVVINHYQTVLVDYKTMVTRTLYNKLTYSGAPTEITIDERERDMAISITKGGVKTAFSAIEEDDVLTVAMSKNTNGRRVVKVYVSSELKSGVLTLVDLQGEMIELDGTEYHLSKALLAGNAEQDRFMTLPDVGTEVMCYSDAFGKVAAITPLSQKQYAYLTQWDITKSLDKEVQIKIFNDNGEWEILALAKKITCMTEKNKPATEVYTKIGANIEPQLIEYKVDGNGRVKELNFAKMTGETDTDYFSHWATKSINYRSQNSSFNHELFVGDNCTIWAIPQDPAKATETDYMIIDKSWFTPDLAYTITAYNVDDFNSSNQIVVVPDSTFVAQRKVNNTLIVEKVTKKLKQDGTEALCLTGFVESYAEFSILVADECDMSDVEPGDFLQVFIDTNGEVSRYIRYYSLKDGCLKPQVALSAIHTTNPIGYYSGTVLKTRPSEYRMVVKVDESGINLASKGSASARVTLCYTNAKELKLARGTYDDIEPTDKVFVAMRNSTIRDIYVVKQ